jgi:RND family efflux transporter MFP subunit
MWLIRFAMGRPITLMVAVIAIVLGSFLAISRMKVDIFPDLNLPVIYVIQPYGGMDAAQMEGFMVSEYEQHFFYISGIDHIESRTIQSASIMKIVFRSDVKNMASAMTQVQAQVERSRAYMPPGTVAPFVLRFDAGNVPVGYLVLSSTSKQVAEIQDLAFVRIRPMVSTLPGVLTPPPFGGNQRTIVMHLNKERMEAYHLSPDELVDKLATGNMITPSGIVRTGNLQRIVRINSTVDDINDLLNIPVTAGPGPSVLLGDVGTVEDSTDIATGYGLVNGKRAVYIAVAKRADASTVAVVNGVRNALPKMQAQLPDDINISFQFDQSTYVTEAIAGVLSEGALGALLTGLVVLLFLKDVRSAIVVVMNIPFALLAAILALWLSGQTINIMTLGGLALSVGILVDEATVAIENIHTHLDRGEPLNQAIYTACVEVVTPQLLAMLSVVSVFLPAFFMEGSTQALFIPLSLAVGFAMIASYVLSNTFLPIVAAWILKPSAHVHDGAKAPDFLDRAKTAYVATLERLMKVRIPIIAGYFAISTAICLLLFPILGREIFPTGNPSSFQLRLKAPTGTRIEHTETVAHRALDIIQHEVGEQNVKVSIGYVGTQPTTYAISNLYMWTSGPQEAVLLVSLRSDAHLNMMALKERLRADFAKQLPEVSYVFEAGDIVNQIMNFGSATPIEVDVNGHDFAQNEEYARRVEAAMRKLPELRDVTVTQPLDYPTIDIRIDRARAGQFGLNVRDIGRTVVASTYSSRFVAPVFWRDPQGEAYQVQIDVPQNEMSSLHDVENIPISGSLSGKQIYLRDVADIGYNKMVGEYDHYNKRRQISIVANLASDDLGRAATQVQHAIDSVGAPPKGADVNIRGQVPSMHDTFNSLLVGVCFAVICILLMLVAYFQSIALSLVVVSIIPAIFAGVLAILLLTGTTINVQSFMGAIMSVGVGVANSILVVVFQEQARRAGSDSTSSAISGASSRLRPVLMTSVAMIAGMIPMALGMGEGGERQAPLGRAVVGGLAASTVSVLFILPLIYSWVQNKKGTALSSLLPDFVVQRGTTETTKTSTLSLILVGVLAITVLSGCDSSDRHDKPISAQPASNAPPVLASQQVQTRKLERQTKIAGELVAYEDVSLYPKIDGYVKWIGVDRGTRVKKGEIIIRIAAPEIEAKVAEARAKADRAKSVVLTAKSKLSSARSNVKEAEAKLGAANITYKRFKKAGTIPGVMADNEIDQAEKMALAESSHVASLKDAVLAAQSEVEAAQSDYAAAQQALHATEDMKEYLSVRAPFDGLITARNVHPGSLVKPSSDMAMVRCQNLSRLRLVVPVPEVAVSGLREGAQAAFTVPAYPTKLFHGTISRLGHALDVRTRTMPVELDVSNAEGGLEPGMYPMVQWHIDRPYETNFVPQSAVGHALSKTYVDVLDGGKVKVVTVTTGQTMDDWIEVFGDIHPGDIVASRASEDLTNGMVISTTPELMQTAGAVH